MAASVNINGLVPNEVIEANLERFREADKRREDFLIEVVTRFNHLQAAYVGISQDFDNERIARRSWQDKYQSVDSEFLSLRQSVENNSFVTVLIDGDAAYFDPELIKKRSDGGAKAAHMLFTEIKQHLESLYPGSEPAVMVHIFANLAGLGGKLFQINAINGVNDVFDFVRGFNTSQPLFNIVDVGHGKEKADHKLREMFRVSFANKQCKHIIFGGCHDNGYLTILKPYQHDQDKKNKITLLETLPAQRGFYELGINVVRFPNIFRNEPLESRAPSPPQQRKPSNGTVTPPTSYASTAVINGSSQKTVSIMPVRAAAAQNRAKPPDYMLFNESDERVDITLPMPPASANDSLHALIKSGKKLCNEHHLKGKCSNGYNCLYSHEPKLSPGEVLALRHKARNMSCPQKTWCDECLCTNGHNCPNEVRHGSGKCTRGSDCYFADTHKMDRRATWKVYEDGKEEQLEA